MKKTVVLGLLVVLLAFVFISCDNDDGDETFTPTTNEVTNDVSTLGLVGTSATSSNTGVATVLIDAVAGKVKITSVAQGSAEITVTDGTNNATINVTVTKTGSISRTITKYNPPTNEVAVAYRGTWYADWDEDEDVGLDPFEITATTIVYEDTTYTGISTQDGGTITGGGGGTYAYFYKDGVKIGVGAIGTSGGTTFGQVLFGTDFSESVSELNTHWGTSPALNTTGLNTTILTLSGWLEEGSGNGLPDGLNTNNPGNTLQADYGLSESEIGVIRDSTSGGFAGWIIVEDEDDTEILQLYWTGRNETQCNALITAIRTLPNKTDDYGPNTMELSGAEGTGTMISANGGYQSGEYRYSVVFALTNLVAHDWNLDFPQGTLVANFWKEED